MNPLELQVLTILSGVAADPQVGAADRQPAGRLEAALHATAPASPGDRRGPIRRIEQPLGRIRS
jgi:hypothetical protein